MILRFAQGTPEDVVHRLRARLEERGLTCLRSPEDRRAILAVIGELDARTRAELERHPRVEARAEPRKGLALVARAFRDGPSVVVVGGGRIAPVHVGGDAVVVVAGPCSVESRAQVRETAQAVAAAGAHILRGGAFKPRTSPHAFQGLGVEGLRQLKAVARTGLPVVLKRGLAATVDEWLSAAEYLAGACPVILCERGIRTFEQATRNTLDLTVLPLLREWCHLPILVDPAHAAGIARIIPPLARAAVAVGADGIAVEVHPRPAEALSDGPQALLPAELTRLVADARVMAAVTGRRLHQRVDALRATR